MAITLEILQEVFKTAFSSDVKINDNTSKENLSEWDSINHLNLIVELEDRFSIQFSPNEIEYMKSVATLQEIIQRKLNA
jgi:acyl carrier protein